MKRLITALVVATVLPLAACTATPPTDLTSPTPPQIIAPASTPTTTPQDSADPPTDQTGMTTSPSAARSTSASASMDTTPTTVTSQLPTAATDPAPNSVLIPATFTAQQRKSVGEAVTVWRHAIKIYDESLQNPAGKDWKSIVYQYINDPAAAIQMQQIDTFVQHGIHQVGQPHYNVTATDANDHNVQLQACVDTSASDVVDAAGRSVALGGVKRFKWTFSISLYPGNPDTWYLNNIVKPQPGQPC